MGTANHTNEEALTYFKKLNDALFMVMRYIDKNGLTVIPTNPTMPVFGENPSHFCVNGVILDIDLFARYRSWLMIQLLEDHPWLIDAYVSILPGARAIVKVAKVLQAKGKENLHETCRGLREALCGDIGNQVKPAMMNTNGDKVLENKLDMQVLPLYYSNGSYMGISKAFSDEYMSVYRKIKTVLNQTPQRETLLGKCLISYALETGKYIAALFLKVGDLDGTYREAVTKVKDYVVAHGLSVGIPVQVQSNADASYPEKAKAEIFQIFGLYGVYFLN